MILSYTTFTKLVSHILFQSHTLSHSDLHTVYNHFLFMSCPHVLREETQTNTWLV